MQTAMDGPSDTAHRGRRVYTLPSIWTFRTPKNRNNISRLTDISTMVLTSSSLAIGMTGTNQWFQRLAGKPCRKVKFNLECTLSFPQEKVLGRKWITLRHVLSLRDTSFIFQNGVLRCSYQDLSIPTLLAGLTKRESLALVCSAALPQGGRKAGPLQVQKI